MEEITSNVSAAIQQQNAATSEIGRSSSTVPTEIAAANDNIQATPEVADQTKMIGTNLQNEIHALGKTTDSLRQRSVEFAHALKQD